MIGSSRDTSLDILLDLHGQLLVVDEKGGHWVKFVVRRVPVTSQRPHGLDYSLTLHDATGERLVGFDNAHSVPRSRADAKDHKHRFSTVKPYAYTDAATLLEDFWSEVDNVLRNRGVIL
jgi:Family of unknown function (DUF6516)